MNLDISSIRHESLSGRRHWAMLVDEATRCKHSFFLKKKSDQVDLIISWLKGLRDKCKMQVKFIDCDNAGENKKLEEKCNIDTATGTPQQKCICEKGLSNNNQKSKSNDELCKVHSK